jgi:hypothetical protein
VDLGHADEARVGEVSAITLHDVADRRDLVLQPETRGHDAPGDQVQHGLGAAGQLSNEIGGLREDRFARQKWGWQDAQLVGRPGVVAVPAVEESDEGSRVDEGRRSQRP